jgi:hypothetical protein
MGRVRGRSSSTIQIFKSSMGLSRRMCRIFVLSTFGPLRPKFARKAVKAACMQKRPESGIGDHRSCDVGMTGRLGFCHLVACDSKLPILLATDFTDIEGELPIELPRLSKPSTQEQLSMEIAALSKSGRSGSSVTMRGYTSLGQAVRRPSKVGIPGQFSRTSQHLLPRQSVEEASVFGVDQACQRL